MNRLRWEPRGSAWIFGRDEERETPRGPVVGFVVRNLLRWSPMAGQFVDMEWQPIAADINEAKRIVEARFAPGAPK